ncbi:MAG TPA: fasciclin domain-containing protein [Candidatus Krumholzibacteria bacterium]|nr:fasciclin domain-containing protein [Candidatus Krumholzibacteria bacterium]
MKKFLVLAAVVAVAAGAVAPSARAIEQPKKPDTGKAAAQLASANNLLAAAKKAGNLNTFVSAVNAAGLADKLGGEGPFTVFAPTDEAFAKLPKGMLEDLMKPANRAQLAGLLGDHVLPGKLMSADMITMKATNVSGTDLGIAVVGDVFMVDDAHVVQRDIAADNGVIHAIDKVLVPAAAAAPAATDKPKDHPAH